MSGFNKSGFNINNNNNDDDDNNDNKNKITKIIINEILIKYP